MVEARGPVWRPERSPQAGSHHSLVVPSVLRAQPGPRQRRGWINQWVTLLIGWKL